MKAKLTLLASLPILLGASMAMALVVGIFPAWGGPTGTSPSETAYNYLDHLKKREWDKAYALTTREFRDKISLGAFTLGMESSRFSEGLVTFIPVDTKTVDSQGDKFVVEMSTGYLAQGAKSVATVTLPLIIIKEGTDWRVDPDREKFLSARLETLPPLSAFHYKGVLFSLKYIVLYKQPIHSTPLALVRIDISNQSGYTLRWNAASPDGPRGYVQDAATGRKYSTLPGYGAQGMRAEGFKLNMEGPERGVLNAPSGSDGSIFVYFEPIPETTQEFNLVLDGFSFPDTGESWSAAFEKAPFRFDTVPPPKLPR